MTPAWSRPDRDGVRRLRDADHHVVAVTRGGQWWAYQPGREEVASGGPCADPCGEAVAALDGLGIAWVAEDSRVRMIRVGADVHARVADLAEREGVTMGEAVRIALSGGGE